MTNNNLTQQQKDRINMLLIAELSKVYEDRYRNQLIVSNNENRPPLDNEKQEQKRQDMLENFRSVVEMYDKDIQVLEEIQKIL